MQPDPQDMARLWDMLDAARAAAGFVHGSAEALLHAFRA